MTKSMYQGIFIDGFVVVILSQYGPYENALYTQYRLNTDSIQTHIVVKHTGIVVMFVIWTLYGRYMISPKTICGRIQFVA